MNSAEKRDDFKVLIIDDDEQFRGLVQKWIQSMGFHCHAVADGLEASAYLLIEKCDLVITDLVMPNMDGMELLQLIQEKYNNISVIAVTGYRKDYSFTNVIKKGAADFLEKPVRRDELEAKINRIIKERNLRSSYEHEIKVHNLLIDLLNLSIENKEMDALLLDFLSCITALPWLELEPGGAVFLVKESKKEQMELMAHLELDPPIQPYCTKVPLGHCLCGRATHIQEIVFVDHVDSNRKAKFKDTQDQGHYCVPITTADKRLLGVFTLYTKAGAKRNEEVVAILQAAAKTLANIIHSKQDELTIARQEEHFRAMTENVLEGIIMMDNQGRVSFWNAAAEKIFGYTSDEVFDKDLHELLVPEKYKPIYLPALNKFFATGMGGAMGRTIEVTGLRKNGEEIPVELSLSDLRLKGSRQVVGIVRDVSERKGLETEKEKLNLQLRQAQKMEAIGTLAGGIAHDFNNILGAIIGFADMARDEVDEGSQVYRDLGRILTAGNRAKDLVAQILTFSRQKEEEYIPVKVQLVLNESLKMLRASIPVNIEIHQNIDMTCNSVLADPTQIHQVIMNLMTNAYHAMPKKGGVISVSLQEGHLLNDNRRDGIGNTDSDFLKLTIKDSGKGMEKEILDRIFDPFFTTKPQGVGTGMGLSLVHGIITELGGWIDVKSELEEGSAFEICIPTIPEAEKEKKYLLDDNLPMGREHILLVDDEVALIEVNSRKLSKMGYRVTARTSSIEALEAFRVHPDTFDLVITDLAMPNMTGLDMAIEMIQLRSDIPIILSSGFVDARTTQHAMDIGIKKVVGKPVSPYEIAQAIREVV